jgi:hypothetical protein
MNRSAAVSIRRSIAVFRLRKAQSSSGLARTSAGNIRFRVKLYGGLQQPDTSFLDEVAHCRLETTSRI